MYCKSVLPRFLQKKDQKWPPTSEDFLRTNSSKLRSIYSIKSQKPFINRLFGTNTECSVSLFVKIKPITQVLKQKTQQVHRAAILKFGTLTRVFVLFITQVNHVISNFRMMQSCTVSLCCDSCVFTK